MTPILAMTWDELQIVVVGGIVAVTAIIAALISAALYLIPKLATLRAAIAALNDKSDAHAKDIKSNDARIYEVALATTPVAASVGVQEIKKIVDQAINERKTEQ